MNSMLKLSKVHHIAIICSNYVVSKNFYTEIMGFSIVREVFREDRQSYKLDLALNGHYTIELFSFPTPPPRPSRPESCGLRHLAFEVHDIKAIVSYLRTKGIEPEAIRVDEFTGKKFTFIADPDNLPLEFYEV